MYMYMYLCTPIQYMYKVVLPLARMASRTGQCSSYFLSDWLIYSPKTPYMQNFGTHRSPVCDSLREQDAGSPVLWIERQELHRKCCHHASLPNPGDAWLGWLDHHHHKSTNGYKVYCWLRFASVFVMLHPLSVSTVVALWCKGMATLISDWV